MLNMLFTPYKIGNCTIPNRLVVPAMETMLCGSDGMVPDSMVKYHEEKAKGGWGLIITEDYIVTPEAGNCQKLPGLWDDAQIEGNKKLTEAVHKHGSKIFCQIYHSGKQTLPYVPWKAIAPSAIKDTVTLIQPREMTIEDIKMLVDAFGNSARRAKEAGFDGIEIHAGHGYLIAQFLSSFVNKRTDQYGGCFENRVRFLDEIYFSIREKVGTDFPISVRISGNEYVIGGRTEAETYELARHLDELGVDVISVSNGAYAADYKYKMVAAMFTDHAINMDVAGEIKKLVSCPVMVANRINDPKMADTLLVMGKADFIAMGRGSLADPYLPKKAQEGRFEEINYCIGCLQGCINAMADGEGFTCLVNPRLAKEHLNDLEKVTAPKHVMIAGTGPAGLMAARTLAQRGHQVSVYDKDTHFGGAFRAAAYPMGKGELSTVISGYRKQCLELGVKFHMGQEVTEALIQKEAPDAIVLATGSVPFVPGIPGKEQANILTAEDVLYGNAEVEAGPVVICGGGEVGAETAEFIAQTNTDVTILEMKPEILEEMNVLDTKCQLLERMEEKHIKILTDARVTSFSDGKVSYKKPDDTDYMIPASTVIAAFGYRAYNPLEEIAKANCKEVYVIGSARKAGDAMSATREGYEVGLKI